MSKDLYYLALISIFCRHHPPVFPCWVVFVNVLLSARQLLNFVLYCVTKPPLIWHRLSPASGGSGWVVVYLDWPFMLVDCMCAYDGAKKKPLEERRAWKLMTHSGCCSHTFKCSIYACLILMFPLFVYKLF
jgi:hypothetical protein